MVTSILTPYFFFIAGKAENRNSQNWVIAKMATGYGHVMALLLIVSHSCLAKFLSPPFSTMTPYEDRTSQFEKRRCLITFPDIDSIVVIFPWFTQFSNFSLANCCIVLVPSIYIPFLNCLLSSLQFNVCFVSPFY